MFPLPPDCRSRNIVLWFNGSGQPLNCGRHQMQGGVDLLVLLSHVHHHPRLGVGDNLPELVLRGCRLLLARGRAVAVVGLEDGHWTSGGCWGRGWWSSHTWTSSSSCYCWLLQSCDKEMLDHDRLDQDVILPSIAAWEPGWGVYRTGVLLKSTIE